LAARASQSLTEAEIQLLVGLKIRQLRTAAGMKAVELARRAEMSQSQLSKIETGKATLSIKMLARLREALDCPLSYLFQTEQEHPHRFGVVGTLITVDGPESRAVRWFTEELGRLSRGDVEFLPLRAAQVGAAHEKVLQLCVGQIDMLIESIALYQDLAPALGFLSVPYSFHDEAHLQRYLASPAFATQVIEPLAQRGIRFVNPRWNWRRGVEWVLAANRPVIEPRDVAGMRVRVPDAEAQAAVWQSLGAVPVTLPWTDVQAALASGAIDAVATHKSHLYPLGFCKHARYVTLLGDVCPVVGVAMNDALWDQLPIDMQQHLAAACLNAGELFTSAIITAERENEQQNLGHFSAVYLRVPLQPWHRAIGRARELMLQKKLLPAAAWRAIRQLAAVPS
jgi:TRAP-type C4-dicarboxylate transport system substrate-binding protein